MRNRANAPTFKEMDLNGDGRITAREFSTAQSQHHEQMLQQQTR
jgi:Ca2+-binding EF-hand superfamily protein